MLIWTATTAIEHTPEEIIFRFGPTDSFQINRARLKRTLMCGEEPFPLPILDNLESHQMVSRTRSLSPMDKVKLEAFSIVQANLKVAITTFIPRFGPPYLRAVKERRGEVTSVPVDASFDSEGRKMEIGDGEVVQVMEGRGLQMMKSMGKTNSKGLANAEAGYFNRANQTSFAAHKLDKVAAAKLALKAPLNITFPDSPCELRKELKREPSND